MLNVEFPVWAFVGSTCDQQTLCGCAQWQDEDEDSWIIQIVENRLIKKTTAITTTVEAAILDYK